MLVEMDMQLHDLMSIQFGWMNGNPFDLGNNGIGKAERTIHWLDGELLDSQQGVLCQEISGIWRPTLKITRFEMGPSYGISEEAELNYIILLIQAEMNWGGLKLKLALK